MTKIIRIGSMVDGMYCPLMIDGNVKNHKAGTDKDGNLFIRYKGKKLTEEKIPMGEEVDV